MPLRFWSNWATELKIHTQVVLNVAELLSHRFPMLTNHPVQHLSLGLVVCVQEILDSIQDVVLGTTDLVGHMQPSRVMELSAVLSALFTHALHKLAGVPGRLKQPSQQALVIQRILQILLSPCLCRFSPGVPDTAPQVAELRLQGDQL